MADNVAITAGAGTTVATDDIGGVHFQRLKVALGPNGTYTADADGTAERGQYVDPRPLYTRISVTPTISTSIYAAAESVGGDVEFANAVRAAGGYGVIEGITIIDLDAEKPELDLVFFDRAVAGTAADQSAFDPTDADLANVVGVATILGGHYSSFADNAVASVECAIPFKCNATSLYCVLVTQAAPTFTGTSDLTVILTIRQL